ncbi:MAG: hypothetical protein ACI4P5_00580 [Candidatus Fimadaptatus sp.]
MAEQYRGYVIGRVGPDTVRISGPEGKRLVDCDSAALARRVVDDRIRRRVWPDYRQGALPGQIEMDFCEGGLNNG